MGGSRGGKSISNKQYFLLSMVGHSVPRGGHLEQPPGSSPAHSAPLPWAPPPPPGSLLWQIGAHPWVMGSFPLREQAEPGSVALAQGREEGRVEEGKKVDQ